MAIFKTIRSNPGTFSKVILNASWLSGARLAGDIGSFILFVVLSRRFGPNGIGKYAYGMAVGLLIYIFFNMGIEEYGIREYSRRPKGERERLFGKLITVQFIVLMPILMGLMVFLVLSRPHFEILETIVILSTYFVFMNLSNTFFIPAYSQQSMALPAISEFACRVGAIAVSIWLVLGYEASLPVALLPLPAFGALVALVAYWSAIRRNCGIHYGIKWVEIKEMYQVAWPFAASNLVFYIYSRLNLIIVSMMLGDAATGYFFTGLKFLETGVLPLQLIGIAAYPILSQNFEENVEAFDSAAEKLVRIDLIAGGMLVWALFFFIPLVLAPILGPKFLAATTVVKGLAFLALLIAFESATIRILFAMNLQARMVRVQTVIAILCIVISLALIPSLGVIGAVAASVLAKLLGIVMYLVVLRGEPVYICLKKSLKSFTAIFAFVVFVSGILFWKTRMEWVPAVAFPVFFLAAIVVTGFLPIFKLGHRSETISP